MPCTTKAISDGGCGGTCRAGASTPRAAAASVSAQVRQVLRAKIVLAAADGPANVAIARELKVGVNTVRKWRGRFAAGGLAAQPDAKRSGRPRVHGPQVRLAVVAAATGEPPHPESTWSHRAIAAHVAGTVFAAISPSQVGRILADLGSETAPGAGLAHPP